MQRPKGGGRGKAGGKVTLAYHVLDEAELDRDSDNTNDEDTDSSLEEKENRENKCKCETLENVSVMI